MDIVVIENLKRRSDVEFMTKLVEIDKICKRGIVGLCHGAYDLLHIGHVRYLMEAKSMCDTLVVSVTSDEYVRKGPGRPIFNTVDRCDMIGSLEFVDYVVVSNSSNAISIIDELRPDLYIKGNEYVDNITPGLRLEIDRVQSYGGKYITTSSPIISNSIKGAICKEMNLDNRTRFIDELRSRYTYEDIYRVFDSIYDKRVLVISDVILDEYLYWDPMDRAPKTSIVAGELIGSDRMGGGGLYMANNAAEYARDVTLLTRMSVDNEENEFILSKKNARVNLVGIEYDKLPTKSRYVYVNAGGLPITTSEICSGVRPKYSEEYDDKITRYLTDCIDAYDIIIVGDFGHGTITDNVVDIINSTDKYTIVNVQTNESNMGFNDMRKYSGSNYLTTDGMETERCIGSRIDMTDLDNLPIAATKLMELTRSSMVGVTAGRAGSIVMNDNGYSIAPVFTTDVVDAIGAGDVFMITSGLVSYIEPNPTLVAFVGNASGALKVSKMCTSTVITRNLLLEYMGDIMNGIR